MDVGAGVGAGGVGEKAQIVERKIFLILEQALDRRARGDGDGDAFAKIDHGAVPGAEEGSAAGARGFALRGEHHAVDQQSVFVAEELRKFGGAGGGGEFKVLRDFAAGWESAALLGDAFEVAAEFDFFSEEFIAGGAVFGGFVGEMRFVGDGELRRGCEHCGVGHFVYGLLGMVFYLDAIVSA